MSHYIAKVTHVSGKTIGQTSCVVKRSTNGEIGLKVKPSKGWDIVLFANPEEAVSTTAKLLEGLENSFTKSLLTQEMIFPRMCICVERQIEATM